MGPPPGDAFARISRALTLGFRVGDEGMGPMALRPKSGPSVGKVRVLGPPPRDAFARIPCALTLGLRVGEEGVGPMALGP